MHIDHIIINLYIVFSNYQAFYQNLQDNFLHSLLHKVVSINHQPLFQFVTITYPILASIFFFCHQIEGKWDKASRLQCFLVTNSRVIDI